MRKSHVLPCMVSNLALAILIGCLVAAGGCTAIIPDKVEASRQHVVRYAAEGEQIKADPVAYLRRLYDRCDALEQYRLTFYRQERVGTVVQTLSPMEQIDALFRKTPFSVKFNWNAPDADYYESVYAEGQNGNKLVIRERNGIFPFPPQVRVIDPALPVKIGKARNAVTDFGLARVTKRTLLPFDDPALAKVMTIRYEGVVDLDPAFRPAHHLRIERPPTPGYAYTRQDFYIDAESLLPAGTDLWLKSGQLGARYRYVDIRTDVQLDDKDFRLTKDHPATIPTQE
ncbi:MAG TPA: DUF1571 domain-containing protein [Phycisphaerae bacterium]|nr:DUF1571 domain-containing protein [Phycisphaerae bacterium]HRR87474.1 DUF1571 domain-containing protein [Phycisphaerae bacterium]